MEPRNINVSTKQLSVLIIYYSKITLMQKFVCLFIIYSS